MREESKGRKEDRQVEADLRGWSPNITGEVAEVACSDKKSTMMKQVGHGDVYATYLVCCNG